TIRPLYVIPPPRPESGVHPANDIKDSTLNIQHRATGCVVVDVPIIAIHLRKLRATFFTLRLKERPHQMRLGRFDIRPPPLINERVDVVVQQENVFAVLKQFETLVLRPSDTDVLLKPIISFRNRRIASVVYNYDLGVRSAPLHLKISLLESLEPVPCGDPYTYRRSLVAVRRRNVRHSVDNDVWQIPHPEHPSYEVF